MINILHPLTLCLSLSLSLFLSFCEVGWICVALAVARWTKFYSTLWSSELTNRILLRISGIGWAVTIALAMYLTVYLPKVKGLIDSSAWSVYCPRVMPTAAVLAVTSFLLFLRGIWPVWGFLSPLVFGTQCMGLLMTSHFIPTMGMY